MTEAMTTPTLVVGVEDFGKRVVDRLRTEIGGWRRVPVRFVVVGRMEETDRVLGQLREAIQELSRTQLDSVQRGRLDVVLLADVARPGIGARARNVLSQLADLVAREFPAALPMSSDPGQRSVALVAVLATGPLVKIDAIRPVDELIKANLAAPARLLSRVYLLSRQHEGGVLTEEDVERGVYLFAASAWFSGLRDVPELAGRLGHRGDSDLVCLFNAAAADVPIEAVVRYCAWRTTLVGLEQLGERCTGRPGVPADRSRSLPVDSWLKSLEHSESLRSLQTAEGAPNRSMGPSAERVHFAWSESAEAIEASLADLMGMMDTATAGAGPPTTVQDVQAAVVALDREELRVLAEAGASIDTFVREQLDPQDGLRRLPDTLKALDDAHALLSGRAMSVLPPEELSNPADSAARATLAAARSNVRREIGGRRGAAKTLLGSLGLAALAALTAAGLWLAAASGPNGPGAAVGASTPAAPTGTTFSKSAKTTSTTSSWVVVLLAGLAGGLTGGGWFAFATTGERRRLTGAVKALESATDQARAAAASASPGLAAGGRDLRERRLARALAHRVEAARLRVAGVRVSVSEAQQRIERELRSLGHREATRSESGDSNSVLGEESSLHRRLFDGAALERLWDRTRETSEDDHWARRLLVAAWPEAESPRSLPFDPAGEWETKTAVQEHAQLLETSVFGWQEVASDVQGTVGRFLVAAIHPRVVGLPVEPADERLDPLASNARSAFLLVAPQEARGAVTGAKEGIQYSFEEAWCVTPVNRIVVLRLHPGCSAAEVAWGIQARGGK
jgi:hypothetical protein